MIGIHASVNWNNGKMQVNLVVKGRCEHPLEHLYTECIREGLRSSLRVAQDKEREMEAKLQDSGIKIELGVAAAPAELSPDAVQVTFEMQGQVAAPAVARPPLFSEFVAGLEADLLQQSSIVAVDLLQAHSKVYIDRLLAWNHANAAAQGGAE